MRLPESSPPIRWRGRSAGSPIVENVRLRTQGCELIARFNVVAYACRGQGLSLASMREAMATLD